MRFTVWLTCLALLWGGAMAGWGQLALAAPGASIDLLADWCASPADTLAVDTFKADTRITPQTHGGELQLHAKVHCDLCVVAADLPSPPALKVPSQLPAVSAGWRPTAGSPVAGLLPWQRPQSRGPPERA
ncbi:DUF2946 family protein [Leptothrix sp. BB-4]